MTFYDVVEVGLVPQPLQISNLLFRRALAKLTPKGQAVRRALCYDGESLFIAESIARESYLDFSQALIQLGVQEAIALVGSIEISLYTDEYGYRHVSNVEHKENATETYIVWVKDL